jgi:excisionase family DNA binding protein
VIETDIGEERYYTISEIARVLRVSDQSVRRWIKGGELRATKPGREYRIGHGDLEAFLRAREPRPLGGSRSPLEPSLDDLLAEERPADVGVPMPEPSGRHIHVQISDDLSDEPARVEITYESFIEVLRRVRAAQISPEQAVEELRRTFAA